METLYINGPAPSPDGRTLYYNDTAGGVMYASRITADGGLADVRVFARSDSADGHPDGPTVDAAGCVWVGLFGGWGVRRYAPTVRCCGLCVCPWPTSRRTACEIYLYDFQERVVSQLQGGKFIPLKQVTDDLRGE